MELSVRYQPTVFGVLLKAVPRRIFTGIVSAHDGDRYDKSFRSWDHLVTLIFVQLGRISGLRELEAVWNAQATAHYHLGTGAVSRTTLSDANQRREPAIFAETFAHLSGLASRLLRREGREVVRLIDATPIPLSSLCGWAEWNGRTRGLKTHVVYDPDSDRPAHLEITPATVNDVLVGREQPIEPGATYVFDKAYVDYAWWHRLHQAGCTFVTRPKTNVKLAVINSRRLSQDAKEVGIVSDIVVELASQQRARLPIRLRRIEVMRDNGRILTIVTNDLRRPALIIAALYRRRWQIELLFRWIKQHLKIKSFIGRSENAIRLQLYAAMIAYLLLRMAARQSRSKLSPIRFIDLIRAKIFERRPLDEIHKPRQTKPNTTHPDKQLVFQYV
jgi:IS4 transposase